MIKEMIKKVSEFHDAFNVKRGNVDIELRYKLFKEEFEEYKDAKDLVERTDAICDMLYIACGTLDVHKWYYIEIAVSKFDEEDTLESIEYYLNGYLKKSGKKTKIFFIINYVQHLARLNGIYDILPELFNEVHASNLSKLDENGKPIINDGVIDPRKPVGKVLKGKNYFEPKLEEILKRYERI